MAKLTAWLVTLIGILLVLAAPGIAIINLDNAWVAWIIALAVLAIGLTKLQRNYKKRKK
jgi:hypothetical protein